MKSNLCKTAALWLAICTTTLAQNAAPAPATEPAPAVAQVPAPTNAPAVDTAPPATASTGEQVVTASSLGKNGHAIIPLIVMDEVPLTDAIQNLARQAELNYLLDPKIGFGQAGPDGKAAPQPMVTVRWENITAGQALTALLNNYNLQLNADSKGGIARITVKDPAAPPQLLTRVIQLKYASPTNVAMSVQQTLADKRSRVVSDVRTSQLVLLATEPELVAAEQLIERLDTATKQVLIEARLIETSLRPSTKKGIDWTGTLGAQRFQAGNHVAEGPSGANLVTSPRMLFDTSKGLNPSTVFLDADGVSAVLSFLNTETDTKVLSTPRTVTLDNETATISVTTASPIFKNTAGTQGSPGGSEVTYTNLGVILNVTPRITANNYVNLRVTPEVSRVGRNVQKTVNDLTSEADEYDIRRLETQVMIPSGNTLVLGGLVQDGVHMDNTKVPLLGDLPLLGRAFRMDAKRRDKANLTIFITPTIIQDTDFQATPTEFLKTKVPVEDSVEGDWSSFDSGKPKDWKKSKKAAADDSKFSKVN